MASLDAVLLSKLGSHAIHIGGGVGWFDVTAENESVSCLAWIGDVVDKVVPCG
jgi:hypothetical protein